MVQVPIDKVNKDYNSGTGVALTSQTLPDNVTVEDVTVTSKTHTRRTPELLPTVFQTDTNQKFLNATLDQLTSPGDLTEIHGFIGRKKAPTYKSSDVYLNELDSTRQNYQLEPGTTIKNDAGKFIYSSTYLDLVNQINFYGGINKNHNRLFESEFYNYDIPIDFDKFINYSHYYWLPSGPATVTISSVLKDATVTHNVVNNAQTSFIINEIDSKTITLIRGNTYKFQVDTNEIPFLIKTTRSIGKTTDLYTTGIINNGTTNSVLEFTVPDDAPDLLFYQSPFNLEMGGTFHIEYEDTIMDVDRDIIGAQNFTSSNEVTFTNGLKIEFDDNVLPISRRGQEYYIENVGSKINLINVLDLETPELYIDSLSEGFDTTLWDESGYEETLNAPTEKDYIVSQRGSLDKNAWSRTNRWFHIDVIRKTAEYNNNVLILDQNKRAERSIIEFNENITLFNYGRIAKESVDLIDDKTTDVFSNLENQTGVTIDGVVVREGFRIIFVADQDPDVRDKIFKVNFIDVDGDGVKKLHFELEPDGNFLINESVLVKKGLDYQGTMCVYRGLIEGLLTAQKKTKINQPPLFDVFDSSGNSFSNVAIYPSTSFIGTTIFEYKVGIGTNDAVLGFPLSFKNFNNIGDIVFNNTYLTGSFTYITGGITVTTNLHFGRLYRVKTLTTKDELNIWGTAKEKSKQYVTTIVEVKNELRQFIVRPTPDADIFEPNLIVHVNNSLKKEGTDYDRIIIDNITYITFNETRSLSSGDLLSIQSYAKEYDNTITGFYNIPRNLESNGTNVRIAGVTLGEIRQHVTSIADSSLEFTGSFPGDSNIRDLGLIKNLGKSIIQNSAGLHKANFLLTDEKANFVQSLKFAQREYSRFKNKFMRAAITLEYDYIDIVAFVDKILLSLTTNKTADFPFYYSDMVPYGNNYVSTKYTVFDSQDVTYELNSLFDPDIPSNRAILIYLNGVLLMKDFDYTIISTALAVTFITPLAVNDVIDIRDFSSTDENFVPQTPTKLGLYPLFKPEKYIDNSYAGSAVEVIRGHDGSITPTYNDFRDDLLLELETRIYNNVKTKYNESIFDILDVIPSKFRDTGYTIEEINKILSTNFLTWASHSNANYTDNNYFLGNNELTWTWSKFKDQIDDEYMLGYYRGIYRYMFDTDQPHTHPWEMLGFSIKPTWWETEYGAAPYTKGNTVLWDDLAEGIIRDGDRIGRYKIYERPGLRDFIPVDDQGNLLGPLNANIVGSMNTTRTSGAFVFGDSGPVENAWRRSSEYPFAIQLLLALTKPAQYFDLLFDTSLIIRELGQIINKTTKTHIQNNDFTVHAESTSTRVSGYNTWISDYLIYNAVNVKTEFGNKIRSLNTNLLYKLSGFSNKKLTNVLAEQVSPTSTSKSIFIPDEDYFFLKNNESSIRTINYSGVMIEKTVGGFKVFGYDVEKPWFSILPSEITSNKLTINVGGELDETQPWLSRTGYQQGDIITYNGVFYAVIRGHTTGDDFTFSTDIYQQLDESPFRGGITVFKYRDFSTTSVHIPYGTEFVNEQQCYDFLISYGRYLERSGYIFDNMNKNLSEIENWSFSGKEFLFWSIQGWQAESTLTVSPGSNQLKFESNDGTVASIINKFLPQTVLDFQGLPITTKNMAVKRIGNRFEVKTHPDASGLYFVKLNIVSNEHTIAFNNRTIFSDVIFEPVSGHRQFRLKVEGHKTPRWQGQLELPGYIFNEGLIQNWEQFRDYDLGELVKFQGKNYVSKITHSGQSVFDFNKFIIADQVIEGIIPNWDTKAEQFRSFYDTSNNNIDRDQNLLAKQLIGYQSREYFENLRITDVSQIQFYQQFIKNKGTKFAVDALIRAQFNNLNSDITFFEEWAFREGEYGSSSNNKILEIPLDESLFTENPIVTILSDPNLSSVELDLLDGIPILKKDIHFKEFDYNYNLFEKVDSTTSMKSWIKSAGYPRLDDVNTTLVKMSDFNSLNSTLNLDDVVPGYVIWTAYDDNVQDWNVYRVTSIVPKIISGSPQDPVDPDNPNLLVINTDLNHELTKNEIIVIKQFDNTINGFYRVSEIITLKQFYIILDDSSKVDNIDSSGFIFKLQSVRYSTEANLNDFYPLKGWKENENVWIDNDNSNKWEVLQKKNPYNTGIITLNQPLPRTNSKFGFSIVGEDNNDRLIVGSPGDVNGQVEIFIRTIEGLKSVKNLLPSFSSGNDQFGYSLDLYKKLDTTYTLFIGAPFSSDGFGSQGKAYIAESDAGGDYNITTTIFTSPAPAISGNFGISGAVSENWLYISEPGENKVHAYQKGTLSPTSDYIYISSFTAAGLNTGDTFGHIVKTNSAGDEIFVSAPYHNYSGVIDTGAVFRFTRTGTSFVETETIISSGLSAGDRFGSSMDYDDNNNYLAVGATHDDTNLLSDSGTIYLFKNIINSYTEFQIINDPNAKSNILFGEQLNFSGDGNLLTISTTLGSTNLFMTFDENTLSVDNYQTTFIDFKNQSGSVTVFELKTDFTFHSQLSGATELKELDRFGQAIWAMDNKIYVGADSSDKALSQTLIGDGSSVAFVISGQVSTADLTVTIDGVPTSSFTSDNVSPNSTITLGIAAPVDGANIVVTKILRDNGIVFEYTNTTRESGWKSLRNEGDLVDITRIKKVYTYNDRTDVVVNFLDFIDPRKGKIAGIADQEIAWKTGFDPAIYTTGNSDLFNVHTDRHWGEKQVGLLWWDMEFVKYIEYEQGDVTYRKNNWGKLFPGVTIDIYEWVKSEDLPSNYTGTGTPKFIDDSTYVERTVYNSSLDVFEPVYYYWVKDTTEIPINVTRTLSAQFVSRYISNPKEQGYKYIGFIEDSSILYYNINDTTENKNLLLHVEYQEKVSEIPTHVEWTLVRENDPDSEITEILREKLFDSLVGFNDDGDAVPDINLSETLKYGVSSRPRQSMFKNRTDAVKVLVDFVNGIFANHQIIYKFDMTRMNSEEPEPSAVSGLFDQSVSSFEERDYINTAELISPWTVLVQANENLDNLWQLWRWNGNVWTEIQTQSYRTSNYWNFIDWYETGFSNETIIDYVITAEVDIVNIIPVTGDIIKILNDGSNKFELLRYEGEGDIIVDDSLATITLNDGVYSVIGREDATIELSSSLYNLAANNIGWDADVWENTLWDDQAIEELNQILDALYNDIFIKDLKIEFNKLWFLLMRYINAEQKFTDWMFKTSFIYAEQNIRSLEQNPVFQSDNHDFVLDFLNEAKPYKTNVREYVFNYNSLDSYGGDLTDFDLPAYYDSQLKRYRSPDVDNAADDVRINAYPYQTWVNNYKFVVGSLILINPGSGYTEQPIVTISGGGGSGAIVVANLVGDKINSFTVTNRGSGYITSPTVTISGGGLDPFNSTQATAYVQLQNKQIRNLKTHIKVDRISGVNDLTMSAWTALPDTKNIADSEYHAADRIEIFYAPTTGMIDDNFADLMYGVDFEGVKVQGLSFEFGPGFDVSRWDVLGFDAFEIGPEGVPVLSGPGTVDTIVDGSSYSFAGVDPDTVTVEGGTYISPWHSHGPEEAIPGKIFESVDIKTYDKARDGEPAIGWSRFTNMKGETVYRRIALANITTLATELRLTDTDITVTNGDVLSIPGIDTPGIIFIGGERIQYLEKTGNVLSRLRRGTQGTGAPDFHKTGVDVFDYSLIQALPGTTLDTIIWYDEDITNATNSLGLQKQNSPQALFLKDKPTKLPS